jgi:assimilatory nitrate reductase catalytic subunit
LNHAAVQVRAAELPWHYVLFGRVPAARQLALQRELRRHFGLFAYAACVPFGFDEANASLLFRAAAAQAPSEQALATIERAFALEADGALRYDDTRRGQRRRVRVEADRVVAASLAGSIDGAAWLRELLDSGASAAAAGRTLLLPHLRGTAARARARVICNCLHVDESQIGAVLATAPPEPLAALQSELKCGTHCGSCLPELRRMAEGRRR